jgi:hypothetical protein
MKRPVGLILTAIVLGFIAFGQLSTAAIMAVTGFIGRNGIPNAPPSTPSLPANFLFYASIGFSVVMALLATWAILTLVGLLRLSNAARISILIIGGCLAIFGGLCVLASFGAIFMHVPTTPPQPAHLQEFIFALVGLFYALIAAIGVWWLIYFSRATVRALFVRSPFAAYDYPLDPTLPAPPLQRPGRFSHVPILIVILACLFILSAFFCVIGTFLPLPAFFFGIIFSGFASHILYLTMAIFTALVGYGLLRLDNRARIATIVILCLGPVNSLLMLLPSGRAQFNLYNRQIMEKFQFAGMPSTPVPDLGYAYMAMMLVFVVIFNGALLWILYRYRADFQRTPPPPALG